MTGPDGPAAARADPGADDRREDGSVVAEFALALPAVLVLLAVVLGGARVVLAQLDCVDAARAGARAAARGDGPEVARAAATALAPAGAAVSVRSGAGSVVVEVSARQALAGALGEVVARGRATAALEDAEDAAQDAGGEVTP